MQNELTDSEYWDHFWSSFSPKRLSGFYPFLQASCGKNGTFLRAMRRQKIDFNKKKVLEVGGACSYFLLALAKWCEADVTAIDYSGHGLKMTEQLFELNECMIKTVADEFLAWNCNESYDVITHWGVLEHFIDPVPILDKCQQILKPGGSVVYSMPNMDAYGAYFWKNWAPECWRTCAYHSDAELKEACSASGLEIKKVFYWGQPLLKISDWEKKGLPQMLISLMHAGFGYMGLLPIYHLGHCKISTHRCFVAIKR